MRGAFLVILGFFIVSTAPSVADAQNATTPKYTRQSLHEFVKDQQKLLSLIRGIYVMKQRDSAPKDSADYRRSWEYWAAIHGYPGINSPDGTVQMNKDAIVARFPADAPLYAGFFTGLSDMTPPATPAGLADKVWATCEHGTEYFLPWHRMYLYFFERVLREASGDPSFSLPYWDYTDPTVDAAQPSDSPAHIPAIFAVPQLQTSTGNIDNPLFDARRTAGFGGSVQIDTVATDVDSTLNVGDFMEFQKTLEEGLHGFIHCAVGNRCLAPYIGLVPFAGNDPIFWVHHANIDRLWDCWSVFHGIASNPLENPDWLKQEYNFVDENGNPVSMKVAELFDPKGRIDYGYDNTNNCMRSGNPPSTNLMVAAGATVSTSEVGRSEQIVVSDTNQLIRLAATSDASVDRLMAVGRPNTVQPARAKLIIKDVMVANEPGASVNVFLSDAGGTTKAFVGNLSFFAAFQSAHHHGGQDYVFDVSKALQELYAQDSASTSFNVLLAASSGVVGGDSNAEMTDRFKNAGLSIGSISLVVETSQVDFNLK
ncbi:tyrosinase family protein [Mesorhizobium sp. M1005]|uniref:tyrosinase family protein n=1 Tax=unclassified Mesorhizobium TaxID=325217 RepID=UPI003335AB9A